MRPLIIAAVLFLAVGCLATNTADNVSGWSFGDGGTSTKRYAYAVVSREDGHPVRSGDTSMRFEVRSGDCGSWYDWDDCSTRRERKELRQGSNINAGERWYHWSIYLPADYPVIWQARETSLGQFHNKNHYVPPFMFQIRGEARVIDGEYEFTQFYLVRNKMDPGYRYVHVSNELLKVDDMRGRWSDFLVHVRWSAGDEGFLRVYVNGRPEPSYEWLGPTNRRTHNAVFFKFGIYTSQIYGGEVPTRVVYFDDVRKGRTCGEVAEYFDCAAITP